MRIVLFAIAACILISQSAFADIPGFFSFETAPPLLREIAVNKMATTFEMSPDEILRDYQTGWENDGSYDDDQPLIFLFVNQARGCLVYVGRQSLLVRDFHCSEH